MLTRMKIIPPKTCNINEIFQISQSFGYVNELQIYKVHRIMKFLGGCPPIKVTRINADMKWIHYAYLRPFKNVKPKNQKEVNHENFSSCKNLDRLSRYQFEKKILSVPTGGSLANFALISGESSKQSCHQKRFCIFLTLSL